MRNHFAADLLNSRRIGRQTSEHGAVVVVDFVFDGIGPNCWVELQSGDGGAVSSYRKIQPRQVLVAAPRADYHDGDGDEGDGNQDLNEQQQPIAQRVKHFLLHQSQKLVEEKSSAEQKRQSV